MSAIVGCGPEAAGVEPDVGLTFCDSPAPLYGRFDPSTPGYIFSVQESVEVTEEVARLSSEYPLADVEVFDSIGGFYAMTSAETMEMLRCEPTITRVEHNAPTMNQ